MKRPINPKNKGASPFGRARWYPYYAGYSPDFVTSTLKTLDVRRGSIILDPWNGSGTTTAVCSLSGFGAIGFDLNPAMAVVAKARLLTDDVSGSLLSLQRAIIERSRERKESLLQADPLAAFFDDRSARQIRAVYASILELLSDVDPGIRSATPSQRQLEGISSLAAFFLVSLFRSVRIAFRSERTKNPTWVRAKAVGDTVQFKSGWFEDTLLLQCRQMIADGLAPSPVGRHVTTADIRIADSRQMPLLDSCCDLVVTSPPYCTRIDYATATRLELAILGVGPGSGFEALRRSLIGSTLTPTNPQNEQAELAPEIARLLARIRAHPSKASSGYYFSTFSDYFSSLAVSIAEIARVVRRRGRAVLVLQDSHYKDVHIDLAALAVAQARSNGFKKLIRWNYQNSTSMKHLNSAAIDSRTVNPVESVIVLQRL